MPVSRMRMRPWLEKMIESQRINGLKWVDEDKTMFSIPWKHAARHGWEMDKDACLFKEWALHTGKYVEGQNSDPKTWKANFRCAMNSLPDVEEVKDKSVNKGHQAVRVFRMLPAMQKSRDKRCKQKDRTSLKMVKMEIETDDSSDADSCTDAQMQENKTQEDKVDSTVPLDRHDFEYMPPAEVPDWSLSVEIEPENDFTNFCQRFEVSPDHSPEYTDIIEICEQLEKDTHFLLSNTDSTGFLHNESCTSPESPSSDSSSGDEPERSPRYLNLGAEAIFEDYRWRKYLPTSFDW